MTNERAGPKDLPIQSALKTNTLPVSANSITSQSYLIAHEDLPPSHSNYRGTALPTPRPNATPPHDQKAHMLPPSGEQPSFDPFIFVNEQELQLSHSNELRRAIRSHVRKATHIKQRRLNAASKPGPTSTKKILKRQPDIESTHPAVNTKPNDLSSGFPDRSRPLVVQEAPDERHLVTSHFTGGGIWEQNPEAGPRDSISGPHASGHGLGASPSYRDAFSQISRYQLDSS